MSEKEIAFLDGVLLMACLNFLDAIAHFFTFNWHVTTASRFSARDYLIDLIISNLAPNDHGTCLEYDESITVHVDICADGRVLLPTGKLHEILAANLMLQTQIYHPCVAYPVPYSYRGMPFDPPFPCYTRECLDGSDSLSHIVRLVPALRKLTISSTACDSREPAYFDESLSAVLDDLQRLCPHLHRLGLIEIYRVPLGYILQWRHITELQLNGVFVVCGDGAYKLEDRSNIFDAGKLILCPVERVIHTREQ